MKAYIVKGHTGEYGDYSSWLVACYTDLERAVQHQNLANEWAKQLGGTNSGREPDAKFYESQLAVRRGQIVCPYDPLFTIDYTGTQYTIVTIDLDPEDLDQLEPSVALSK